MTSGLDLYLSVAQVQLLQQLLRDNMVGMDAPEGSSEVDIISSSFEHICRSLLAADGHDLQFTYKYLHCSILIPFTGTILGISVTFKYLLSQSKAVLGCDLSLLHGARLQLSGSFPLFTAQGAPRRRLPRLTA